jgi:hypothetical protein
MEREMPQGFFDETKATARLPNLDIEIVRSRSPAGDAERITIRAMYPNLTDGQKAATGGSDRPVQH